jgi:hypothetical protein
MTNIRSMRIKKVVRCVAKVDVVENWAQAGQASCGTSSLERLVPAEGLPVVSAVAIAGRCSHQGQEVYNTSNAKPE